MGDWLASLYDQNPISELDSAAALQVERDTVAMLRALFRLPAEFEGTLVTGATLSNFVGLAVAREWAGRERGTRVSAAGLWQQAPVPVLAATPHASAGKALSMLGMGRSAWQPVACLPGREAMDVAALESALEAVEGPAIVVASAGTVNTGDFDDFRALAALKARRPFWLHVDAAFGGFARLSPGLKSLVAGWEAADSLCLDLHKWLNVPYDAAVAFTRHRPLQVEVFASASAYLGAPGDQPEPIHLAPENSHRWRALPAWFSLLAYGAEGHRQIVERDCALARELGERLAGHPAFELLAPVRLNVVCFALKGAGADDHAAYVRRVRDGGATFISPTVLRQRPALRAAFSHWQTGGEDLERVWGGLVGAVHSTGSAGP